MENAPQVHRFGQQEIQPDGEGLVSLRGFLYQSPDGFWILSQEPQLKSCCIGSSSKIMDQLYVTGNFTEVSSGTVVELTGVFKVDPQYDQKGNLTQYYTLQEAVIERHEIDYTPFIWVGIILAVILVGYFFNMGKWLAKKP